VKIGKKSGPPPKKGPASQGVTLKSGIKVLKAKGGMDASQADFGGGTPGPGDTGGSGGFEKGFTDQFGVKGSPTSTGNVKTPPSGNKGFTMPPVSKVGLAIAGLKAIENQRRAKRAKGEFFTSSKKIMPVTRDFYKVEGRPLQTQIGSPDKDYLKATGVTGTKGTFYETPGNDNQQPIKIPPTSTVPIPLMKVKPKTFDFEYKDGGLVRGSGKVLKGRVKKARIY
jgi:hypothetical protein